MAEATRLSKTPSYSVSITEILRYVNTIYRDFVNIQYGIHIHLEDMLKTISSKCFIVYKNKNTKHEVRIFDGVWYYQLTFKTTSELCHIVDWKYFTIPTYDIVQKMQSIAIAEIAHPIQGFIQDKLRAYDPKFNSDEGRLRYERCLSIFLNTVIFPTHDIHNKRYYLIIRK